MEQKLSRRSFIGMGAVAAMAAGAGLAGCAPQAGSEGDGGNLAATGAADIQWDKETDVVVVGFGGAGSAAAIEAARGGAEVVLLEELSQPGGSTAACGGFIMMGGTKLQEQFDLEDSTDNFYNYLVAAAGENANKDAIRVLADKSPELYDWCVECGMDFASGAVDVDRHLGGYNAGFSLGYSGNEQAHEFAKAANPVPRGHMPQPGSSGADIFAALSATVESEGVEVLLSTPGRRLVVGDDGRVVGIIAEGSDGEMAIKARKGVVLTAGGFGNNDEMLNAYYPYTNRRGPQITAAGNENGSGILMGQAIGADTRGMGCFQIGTTVSTLGDAAAHCIIVDANGHRIVAEDEYNAFVGKATIQAPTSDCYLLIEKSYTEDVDLSHRFGDPMGEVATIEEAAQLTGVNADVLKSTVDFYNASAAAGEDREFGKAAKYLTALEKAPFVVYYAGSETLYTASCGGLKIDTDAHVIDLEGNVIPGLYAAGRNAGTIYGWYMGSGSSMADVLTFGRIAGQNVAAEEAVA